MGADSDALAPPLGSGRVRFVAGSTVWRSDAEHQSGEGACTLFSPARYRDTLMLVPSTICNIYEYSLRCLYIPQSIPWIAKWLSFTLLVETVHLHCRITFISVFRLVSSRLRSRLECHEPSELFLIEVSNIESANGSRLSAPTYRRSHRGSN